jgi:hypothetical protein
MRNGFKEVSFAEMLSSDSPVICEHWLLSNGKKFYGVDFTEPMYFNVFLEKIGENLSGMNCKGIFESAKWYIINEKL